MNLKIASFILMELSKKKNSIEFQLERNENGALFFKFTDKKCGST